MRCLAALQTICHLRGGACCRDMSVEDAVELGQRSIYHATFRDAVSGGTVSGKLQTLGLL